MSLVQDLFAKLPIRPIDWITIH